MNQYVVAFFVFAFIRYFLPRTILGKKIIVKNMIVMSIFFALALYMMNSLENILPVRKDEVDEVKSQ